MAYTPKNVGIFTAAFAGALAGMGASDRVPSEIVSTAYTGLCQVAGAYAQQFDTTWAFRATTGLDRDCVRQLSEAVWQDRSPQAVAPNLTPSTYAGLVNALIAQVTAAETYFSAQGIVPPVAIDGNVQFSGTLTATGYLADSGDAPAPSVPGAFTYPFPSLVALREISLIITGITPGQSGTFNIVLDDASVLAGPFPITAEGFFTYTFNVPGISNAGVLITLDAGGPFNVVARARIGYTR